MRKFLVFLFPLLLFGVVLAAPSESSLVVSSTEPSSTGGKEDATSNGALQYPSIYQMDITSNISNRFATTLVVSKVKNIEKVAKETTFTVVLPDKAFISEFVMEIGGKSYKAYVKEKEEAKDIYNKAVASGQSAGHVAVSARNSNKFTVSVNVEPEAKVVFLLTYEELLERRNGQYEQVVNIRPGQIVKDLNVKVQINETRPLKFVRTPSLRSGNEISKNEDKLDPSSDIQIINSTSAVVKFNPDSEKQKQFAHDLGDKESDGLSGQFVVQYDIDRDPHGGEVLLRDGYFVHFFAPEDLEPLPKHVLFVLDSSGSMAGRSTIQVKDALHSILDEIREEDLISVIDFGSVVSVWDIPKEDRKEIPLHNLNYEKPFTNLSQLDLPAGTRATKDNLYKAKQVTDKFYSSGGTFMIGGLEMALYLAKITQDSEKKYQPIMIFLTDGQPNIGLSNEEEIVKIVTRLNAENNNIPIFSLSFGEGANKEFLRKLSLKNQGFSRHIYEASDASLQLQEFYKQISSPLLSNITFIYNDDVQETSKTRFPVYFKGSEIVVTGRYHVADSDFRPPKEVSGRNTEGKQILKPKIETPVSSLERLWAYLTVKQTLDERELVENKEELTKKALDLALKYSFVTDITSLVVVKPNETNAVNTEDASKSYNDDTIRGLGRPHGLTVFGKRGYLTTPASPVLLQSFAVPDGQIEVALKTPVQSPPSDYHWLSSALNPNGTITVAEKTYELGETYIVADPKSCPELSINNTQSGRCVLLKDCPELSSTVIDFQTYQQYFCSIEEKYAGICCPKRVT
ncbi:inter-alpha-trypsin inhibitor heavy chain H4-like isoform X2 [Anoplophora glabripennis]|uniref:inter-alpha-trypsin inhibitor heavy chain H4-like isoform X2 n=1 Tax=Anoplophora glabripennis TaxID=217634 RepID=UPI000873ADF5|nr:inter-alpha-trypsin inhibitor heavy chain H4-like isoform X2 [Anoplophora glabripennis]